MNLKTIQHFKESEFECKCGCGLNIIDESLVLQLDIARSMSRVPFVINSACRCIAHNKAVGGLADSAHLKGLAVDIKVANDEERHEIVRNLIFFGGFKRLLLYPSFVHVDIDYTKPYPILKIM